MYKQGLKFLIPISIFLLFLSVIVNADETVDPRFDPDEPNSVKNANSATINANIERIDQAGKLSEVDISKLSNENVNKYISKLSSGQKQNLNAQQLAYIKDGKATLDLVKANEVSKEARDGALKILGRTPNVETETDDKPSTVTTNPDGFSIDYIHSISIDGIRVINAYDLDYSNNFLAVGKAETILIKDGLLSDVSGFKGNIIEFNVKEVRNVINKCVSINNVKNSKFKITDEIVQINSDDGVNFNITDCSLTQSQFKAISNNSQIEISKTPEPHYSLKESEIICNSRDKSDKLEALNQASIDYGTDCFTCMTIIPAGTYFYLDADIRKDFSINVPKESSAYKLCLRKNIAQQFKEYNGLVDFVDKKIELNGIVNYLRYSFRENQLLSFLSDFVYKGNDVNNKVDINLNKDFLFVNNLSINNKNPNNKITNSYSGYHEIIEIKETRFAKINKQKLYPDLIKRYKTEFENSTITIKNSILIQNGNANVKILTINSPNVRKVELFLQNYWHRSQNIMLSEHLE